MPYTPILATLGYILSPDGRRVLLVHRNRRPDDAHYGKYNGLGGKLDPGEDIVTGIRREVREESGLECETLLLRGTISWPGCGKHGEDWFGFIFRVGRWKSRRSTRRTSRCGSCGTCRTSPTGWTTWGRRCRARRWCWGRSSRATSSRWCSSTRTGRLSSILSTRGWTPGSASRRRGDR